MPDWSIATALGWNGIRQHKWVLSLNELEITIGDLNMSADPDLYNQTADRTDAPHVPSATNVYVSLPSLSRNAQHGTKLCEIGRQAKPALHLHEIQDMPPFPNANNRNQMEYHLGNWHP